MSHPQLTLGVSLRDDATFNNFFEADNVQLVAALKSFLQHDQEQFIYLWGEPSVGRSHLLQACCHEIGEHRLAVYLSLRDVASIKPAVLEGLDHMDLVCLDDIDAVLGHRDWEEALFHFYNRARENHTRLIVVGSCLPTHLTCLLPDLCSRLSWGLVFQVKGLSDQQKIAALQMRAHRRGMSLSEEVGQYLLHHYPRDMSALFEALDKLDQASLAEKRRITVPFVKQVL